MLRILGASSTMVFCQKETLRGPKHRAKRQRLQRDDDAIHATINGVGVIGRLRRKRRGADHGHSCRFLCGE